MSVVEIPRSRQPFERGTYRVVATEAGNRHVVLTCPNGHTGFLDHEIADDGTVTPSVECPEHVCGWHVMIRLEDWDPKISQEMRSAP